MVVGMNGSVSHPRVPIYRVVETVGGGWVSRNLHSYSSFTFNTEVLGEEVGNGTLATSFDARAYGWQRYKPLN